MCPYLSNTFSITYLQKQTCRCLIPQYASEQRLGATLTPLSHYSAVFISSSNDFKTHFSISPIIRILAYNFDYFKLRDCNLASFPMHSTL